MHTSNITLQHLNQLNASSLFLFFLMKSRKIQSTILGLLYVHKFISSYASLFVFERNVYIWGSLYAEGVLQFNSKCIREIHEEQSLGERVLVIVGGWRAEGDSTIYRYFNCTD